MLKKLGGGEHLEAFLEVMHKSKVAQNPEIWRKPYGFFNLSILCALKMYFLITQWEVRNWL